MPKSSLEVNLAPILTAIKSSVAPHTWADYSAAWQRWVCTELGLSFLAPSEQIILAFLCSLMQFCFSYNHINKILAGVSFFMKLNNLPSCTTYFSVKQALKGYRRANFSPDNRRPISLEVLRKLCLATAAVCYSDYEARLFSAAFVLCFFAALRISELVAASSSGQT